MRLTFYDTVENCSLELETSNYKQRELLRKIYLKILKCDTIEMNQLLSKIIEEEK